MQSLTRIRDLILAVLPALGGRAPTVSPCVADQVKETKGCMAATQTPNGVIHLISSALHYRFNLAWLKKPMPESGQ